MTDSRDDDRRPGLKPPRFGLSTMMWLMALLCGVFAVMGTAGPYMALMLILFVLAVLAHVAGNAIGTYLRENGDRPIRRDGTPIERVDSGQRELKQDDYAPVTRLGRRYSLGLIVIVMTTAGVLVGAAGGGTLLTLLNWQRITPPVVAFAVAFCGVLGGMTGFLASSFAHVMVGAQLEALREAKRR